MQKYYSIADRAVQRLKKRKKTMKYLGTYKTKRRTNNKTRCNCETFREIHSEGEGNA